MSKFWNLNNKKWLWWTGLIGFFLPLIFSLIAAGLGKSYYTARLYPLFLFITPVLYLIFDRKKPKTKDYHIEKVYMKWILIMGNIYFITSIATLLFYFLIGAK